MRKRSIIVAAFTCLFLVFIAFDSLTNGSGALGGYTGAPGESNCTSCHTGAGVNSGKYIKNIELFGDFHGGGYVPDSVYNVTVRYKQAGKTKIGFSVTALDANNNTIGSMTDISSRTNRTTANVGGKTREYITHTTTGTSVSGDSILWTFEWKAPSSNIGNADFYIALNVTNANGQNSGDSIYTKKISVGTSNLLPTATATSDTNVYCAGTSITMKGSGTGSPTAYSWSFPGGNPTSSTQQNPSVTYNFQGTFLAILRVQNTYGMSDPDTFKITVLNRPAANIAGTFPATICPDDSVLLQAPIQSGNTYLWSTGATTDHIYAKSAGKYSVEVTNSAGCSRMSQEVEVKEFTRPVTTITSDAANDTACTGSNVTFTGTGTFDTFYLFKNFQLVSISTGNQMAATVDESAVYNMKVRDANGCMSNFSDTLELTVLPKLPAPQVMCSEVLSTSILFAWQDTSGTHTSGYEVSADSGKTWSSPNTSATEHELTGLLPEKNYQLSVRALSTSPCFVSNEGIAVCKTAPCNAIDVSVTFDSLVCVGETVNVIVAGLSGHFFSLSFEGGPAFTDSTFTFDPSATGIYILELTDSANLGCPVEQIPIPVEVDVISPVTLRTADNSDTYCEGDSIVFIASAGNELYRFYVNGVLQETTQDSFVTLVADLNLDSVYVVAEKGVCSGRSGNIQLTINPAPDAQFTFTRDHKVYTFTPDVNTYTGYLWDFGDGNNSVLVSPTHDYGTSSGQTVNASLTVMDAVGCESMYSESIDIPDFSSVRELADIGVRFYPNPASGRLNLEFTNGFESGTIIEIVDLNGHVVNRVLPVSSFTEINIEGLSSGVYMLQISSGSAKTIGRLMVE